MSKIKPELISIFKIQVFRSVIDALPEYTDNPVKPANFRVGFSQNSAFNVEMQSVRIRLEILLDGIDQDDQLVGVTGNFSLEFHIHVANFEEFVVETDGDKKISNLLLGTLLSIAYSTARGIVFERTQGTWLNGVILPVIDPKELESGGSGQ